MSSSAIILTGAPHFKAIARQHRSSNYTLTKVLYELMDNALRKSTEINITTRVETETGKLRYLNVSDNCSKGFEDIHKQGPDNPFNMGHMRSGQNNDDDTGMYGVGMKAGAISAGNKLSVMTKVEGEYFQVDADFMKMESEPDVNKSFNPKIMTISEDVYSSEHPFTAGSSVSISEMRSSIYGNTTQEELTAYLIKQVASTYDKFIKNGSLKIVINGTQVEPMYDLFEDPKCKPFTVIKKFHMVENNTGGREIFVERIKDNTTWSQYNIHSKKMGKCSADTVQSLLLKGYNYTNSISPREVK